MSRNTYAPLPPDVADDIENRFRYHAPKDNQPQRYEAMRAEAKELAFTFAENVPRSRELSLALTHLEMALMCANAGIARNE